jgi:hypothetical protein
MIKWKIISLGKDGSELECDLFKQDELSIKETDSIQFQITVDEDTFIKFGSPYIILGDVPIELEFHHFSEMNRVFFSVEPLDKHSSKYFYNFFGESELGLAFEDDELFLKTITVNILARAENAKLASEMLDYITDNLEDAVSICFSRSKISGSNNLNEQFNFTRLDIIEETIEYISDNLPLFIREHKYTWKPEMQLSEQGQPTGPDSIHWVLTNLDRVSPACIEESNLLYNNRSYRVTPLPKENIVQESDVYENRVINTFLYHISIFLIDLKDTYGNVISAPDSIYSNSEYVRFDHTMEKYTKLAMMHKTRELDKLLFSIEKLRAIFNKKIPSKIVPGIQPKLTSYVSKHPHYRKTFKLIEQCNAAPAPNFEGDRVLLGLKNLAIVYEIASLLMLNQSIKTCFGVQHVDQSFRVHSEDSTFGGYEKERPYGEINNLFLYSSDIFTIELFFEPKIFPMSGVSKVGDLVDTSDTRRTRRYGQHHFCPDFIIKINSNKWKKPVTIVLDSKYKNSDTIKKFDMVDLTQKYLLNIHQIGEGMTLGVSPIQLLLIIFAHNSRGNYIRTVAAKHTLTGDFPVLPQAAGILLKPTETSRLDEHLNAFIEVMNRECHF